MISRLTISFSLGFPIRYYIIDFEFAVRFAPDSKPEDRKVSGLPILKRGYDHPDDYGRDLAQEIVTTESSSPFKAAVFPLGTMLHANLHSETDGFFPFYLYL